MQKHPHLVALGSQIRKLREKQNYSQEAFAEEVGLDRAYYGGVERGERNISAINLIKIIISLNVEAREIFPSLKNLKKYI